MKLLSCELSNRAQPGMTTDKCALPEFNILRAVNKPRPKDIRMVATAPQSEGRKVNDLS